MDTIEVLAPAASRVTNANSTWRGLSCSLFCVVHCAVIPLLLWLFPFLSDSHWLRQPIFRQCVAVVCMGVIIQELVPRCRRYGFRGFGSMATIGLTTLFTVTFILPDLCCGSSATAIAEARSIAAENFAGRVPFDAEYCSYFGESLDEIHEPIERIYLAPPLITSEKLKLMLSVKRMQVLETIYPWLSPFSAVLLMTSPRLNWRRRPLGILRSCAA